MIDRIPIALISVGVLLLSSCATYSAQVPEQGRPGEPGYQPPGTLTWTPDPGGGPPVAKYEPKLVFANDRTRRINQEREAEERGRPFIGSFE